MGPGIPKAAVVMGQWALRSCKEAADSAYSSKEPLLKHLIYQVSRFTLLEGMHIKKQLLRIKKKYLGSNMKYIRDQKIAQRSS